MAKIKQSPKMPAEKRKEQLLASAKKLFVKKGYRGTTTEEIARKAGLTKGAFYFYFKKKEDILLELIKSMAECNRSALDEKISAKTGLADLFDFVLDLHCKGDMHEYGDMVDIWVQAWRIPRIKKYIATRLREWMKNFSGLVPKKGFPRGTGPDDLALLIIATVDGLSTIRLMTPELVDLDKQQKLFRWLLSNSPVGQAAKN